MANFDEFRQKAKKALGTAADATKEFAGAAASKAKELGKITKLRAEISREKDNIRRIYMEMGHIYYENHKDDPEEPLAQACAEVSLARSRIEANQLEIELLKAEDEEAEEDIEAEIEITEDEEPGDTAENPEETAAESADEEKPVTPEEDEIEETEGAE